MGRPPRQLPATRSTAAPAPAADDVVRTLAEILAPLVRLMLASGVNQTRLAAELKSVFAEQARLELLRTGRNDTDSAISLLSGVHRKDVREWRVNGLAGRGSRDVSVSSRVFAHWVQDPLYRDRRRHPKPLPRLGPAPSFETLARSVTQDLHPYTLLTELIRLGLVQVQVVKGQEMVVPNRDGFVPPPGSRELLELFGANLADHSAAAVGNLLGQPARLEQSVFAEGLRADSVEKLSELARKLWAQARSEMIAEALRHHEADQAQGDATCRMRFGTYYWAEDSRTDTTAAAAGQGEHRED